MGALWKSGYVCVDARMRGCVHACSLHVLVRAISLTRVPVLRAGLHACLDVWADARVLDHMCV
eukprot:10646383-Alexandrium_andersonii.AAC.1